MCNFKSALLIPRFPSSDGFDIFHRDGVDSHTTLMELANINPNDKKINVAKLELLPDRERDPSDINTWKFDLDESRWPDWMDDAMLADAEYEMRKICSRYLTKDGEYTILDFGDRKEWYLNGELHREDGPAIERLSGGSTWYINGKLHREDGPVVEWPSGTKEWRINGLLHRTDGPAIEYADGSKSWYINEKLHREDGPAVENADGHKEWWINSERHREDGPAVEWSNGTKSWYLNGKRHREDGPAVEYADGTKFWWINGESLTEEEFNSR